MIDKTDIVYTFNKSYNISYNQDYFCCLGDNVNLYSLKSGKSVLTFNDIKHPNYSKFLSNGCLIVKTTAGNYYIYNLDSMSLVKKIPQPKNVLGSTTDFQVTSDNKYIIDFSYVFPTYQLMIIEIETGTYTFFDIGYSRKGFVFSTETESKYYVIANCAETPDAENVSIQNFYQLSYNSGEHKLQKLSTNKYGIVSAADYASNKFVLADYDNKITLFDTRKNIRESFEYTKDGVLYDLKLSKNGKYIALAESQNVYIYDLIEKKCIKKFEVKYGCFIEFFDNDTKLLIGTWEKGYCVSLKKL